MAYARKVEGDMYESANSRVRIPQSVMSAVCVRVHVFKACLGLLVGRVLPPASREDLQDTKGIGGETADEVAETVYDAQSAWDASYWNAAGSSWHGAPRTTNRTPPK